MADTIQTYLIGIASGVLLVALAAAVIDAFSPRRNR